MSETTRAVIGIGIVVGLMVVYLWRSFTTDPVG